MLSLEINIRVSVVERIMNPENFITVVDKKTRVINVMNIQCKNRSY